MRIAIVIPAWNESATIAPVVREVACVAPEAQIVVVDDGSGDDTAAQAEQAGARVLRHLLNRGQGAALQTGTRYALEHGAEIVVHFDADGQHRAEDILTLAEPIMRGEAEVAFGSRFLHAVIPSPDARSGSRDLFTKITNYQLPMTNELIKSKIGNWKLEIGNLGMPWSKRTVILPLARLINRLVAGMWLSDAHCGLRALSRRAAEAIEITQDRMAHGSEIPAQVRRAGFRFIEVPVSIRYREYGQGIGGGFAILRDLALGRFL